MPGNGRTVVGTAGFYFELCRAVDTKKCEHAQLNNVKNHSVKIQGSCKLHIPNLSSALIFNAIVQR